MKIVVFLAWLQSKILKKLLSFQMRLGWRFGRLLVAGAVGLLQIDVQALWSWICRHGIIDTAHGHSAGVLRRLQFVPTSQIVHLWLQEMCNLKVLILFDARGGQIRSRWSGSINSCCCRGWCSSSDCYLWHMRCSSWIWKTIIADGGIKYSGDIVKALTLVKYAWRNTCKGTDEAPGETEIFQVIIKTYRGMGSITTMKKKGSSISYFQGSVNEANKLVWRNWRTRCL